MPFLSNVYCLISVSQMPVISNGATFNGFLLNAQQVGWKQISKYKKKKKLKFFLV